MDWKFAFNLGEQLQLIDRTERHEFKSQFLCVVGKQRRTQNAGMGLTIQYLYVN